MMNTLTCPLPTFRRLLQALAEDRGRTVFIRVGIRHAPPDHEWLVRDLISSPPDTPAPHQGPVFRVALTANPPAMPLTHLPSDPSLPGVVGHLYLGHGQWHGYLWGVVRTDGAIEPLHRLCLVGTGMHQIRNPKFEIRNSNRDRERWSRTMGALGGEAVWQRLVGLRVAVVGCGRTGSLVAVTLARLGIRRLTLIDPDIVEVHNLGEMDAVTDDDLGRPKAEAIVGHLRSLLPHASASLFPIVAPIAQPAALAATKGCDVLFCCADNDAARLATAILSTLYHKVLVDIGTGVHFTVPDDPIRNPQFEIRNRIMGADVRLILPGDGCLLCQGNLTDYAQAVDDLCNHRPPAGLQVGQRNWRRQRAGSLRTLNQLAAALGVQMLQDLVAERLRTSTWTHVEFDEVGRLAVEYPPMQQPAGADDCALCAKAGLGDEGLGWTQ
ncbi:MAG: ThiF family adenylyltransferase [Anaerolineae bacterium]